MTELDLDRLPYETRQALDRAGILVDQLDPGLSVVPQSDHLEVYDAHGDHVCDIEHYRLAPIDTDLIPPIVAIALTHFPQAQADRIAAAINNGEALVHDLIDRDFVTVDVPGQEIADIHRCHLIPSWPEGDPDAA